MSKLDRGLMFCNMGWKPPNISLRDFDKENFFQKGKHMVVKDKNLLLEKASTVGHQKQRMDYVNKKKITEVKHSITSLICKSLKESISKL